MRDSHRRRRQGLALLLIAAAAGCSDVVHPEEGPVDSIAVEPAEVELEEGAETRLTARLYAASGAEIRGPSVFWASEDPEVATLADNGVVRGVKRGTTRVAASAEGIHGVASVRVVPVPVGSIELSPDPLSVAINETASLNAVVRDRNGAVVTDRGLTWASSVTSVAQVNSSGVVTGLVPGRATITASAEGVEGSAEVVVTPGAPAAMAVVSGNSQQGETGSTLPSPLVVRVTDAKGNAVAGVQVQWTAQHGAFTSADERTNDSGEASATWRLGGTVGQQRATARAGALSAGFSATASETPVGSVAVSPAVAAVAVQATQQMTAAVRDSAGGVLDRPVEWSSSNSNVAQVSSTGLVTGVTPGRATIKATSGGVDGTAQVTVTPGAPSSIDAAAGNEQQAKAGTALPNPLVAKVTDAGDNPVPDVTVQWTAEHGSVQPTSGTTNSNGEVSTTWTLGPGDGTQRAHATAGSLTTQFTATASATPAPVASVEVEPDSAHIGVLGTVQLEASLRDAAGNVLTDRQIGWSTNNALVATVNSNGRVAGIAPGTATITATSEGIEGTAFVRVSLIGPAAISIASGNNQVAEKKTTLPEPLVVRVTDALGNGLPSVTVQWSANRGGTVNPSSSTTDASGHATTSWTLGEPVGEHNVTAVVGSHSVTFSAQSTAPAGEEISSNESSSQPHRTFYDRQLPAPRLSPSRQTRRRQLAS